MSMTYCFSCDMNIDSDEFEFYDDKTCMKCHLKQNETKDKIIKEILELKKEHKND